MSVQEMRDRITAFADKECGRGASDADIAAAEHLLGVTFSESYRGFLSEIGWGRFGPQELYGLGSDVPAHLSLVRNTLVERSEMQPALPLHLIPVMNDGAGNHYCLDTLLMRDGECPIVLWDHEQRIDQVPERIALTFDLWLIATLDEIAST